ncbi:dTDP-4-dehydrorhamnose reductase [Winogradskyella sp.]|uniref:dTDP-4-dehydrorhamnose reductase n=1 Tax=Winogradskyella sp. TaxID=1883156 RepID=UPI003F6C6D89
MIRILVTGGEGQLAKNIKDLIEGYSDLDAVFTDVNTLDVSNSKETQIFFLNQQFEYCINCAAYTAVDKAEKEEKTARTVNEDGAKNLAEACKQNNVILIHISTDFVFDGNKSFPYTENDKTNPLSIYGRTKLNGERAVEKVLNNYFIIRTSWLYSEYNANFMKTMLSLSKFKKELSIVEDQIGTPTYAKDLASLIIEIINSRLVNYGLYHFSNEGVASWYDFAKEIFEHSQTDIKVVPIKTKDYPTLAQRPYFSVLDKSKIKSVLDIKIPYWRDSLKIAIKNYNKISN